MGSESLFQRQVGAWVHGGQVTGAVAEMMELFGVELDTSELAGVVKITQAKMKAQRDEGVERWQLPELKVTSTGRLGSLASDLGMSLPMLPTSEELAADVVIVLGAMLESMAHRLKAVVDNGLTYQRLCIVTAVRALTQKEQDVLAAAGIDPTGKTEADAARFLLDRNGLVGDVVAAANKPNGKRATTEETITALAETLGPASKLIFISHQPFRLRQWMTILRALRAAKSSGHQVVVLGAPMLKPIGEMASVLFDEACRILYEISLLPPELLTNS